MHLRLASLLVIACLPLGLAACGDDDDDGGGSDAPQVFEVEATDKGVTAQESVEPGAIEIRFTNSGKQNHNVQIIEIGEGHTPAEVGAAGEAWGDKGKALPEWISFAGGVGTLETGEAASAIVELPEGEYVAFDIEGRGKTPYAEFTVEGDEGSDLPETDGSVEASEYAFTADGLTSGRRQVRFENAGEEPHHLIGAPLLPGKTLEDAKKFVESEGGPPAIDEKAGFDTAILSGGQSTVVDLDLKPGKYAFFCFIPDREGGPPHALKGMVSEATVE